MRRLILPMVLAFASGLSGCVTRTDFDGIQEAAKGSPALRERAFEKCVAENKLNGYDRKDMAAMMNVRADADVERILCRRIIDALASGRLTYEDYNSMARGEVNPRNVRIIQGR